MELKPFTPAEAKQHHMTSLPTEVLAAINELLSEKYTADKATITLEQEDVLNRIESKMEGISRERILANHWLDIEATYEHSGWKVRYDKPSIGETWVASFVFTPTPA